jgi:hypothetical protein
VPAPSTGAADPKVAAGRSGTAGPLDTAGPLGTAGLTGCRCGSVSAVRASS